MSAICGHPVRALPALGSSAERQGWLPDGTSNPTTPLFPSFLWEDYRLKELFSCFLTLVSCGKKQLSYALQVYVQEVSWPLNRG